MEDSLIITPGLNKYREGYSVPFDIHRARANEEIDKSRTLSACSISKAMKRMVFLRYISKVESSFKYAKSKFIYCPCLAVERY